MLILGEKVLKQSNTWEGRCIWVYKCCYAACNTWSSIVFFSTAGSPVAVAWPLLMI